MNIEYRVKENKVVAVRAADIRDTWVPVKNVPFEDKGKIERNLEELEELLDVPALLGLEEKGKVEALADDMTDREKKLVKLLGNQEVSKVEIDKELKTEKRQIAGVLANLTQKAKGKDILEDESAVLHRERDDKRFYYLHPKLKGLLEFI